MPSGLERWHGGDDLHFITFSCYHRQPLLGSTERRDLFLRVLEQVRQRYGWVVMGYVVMPEHVHLLVSEPRQGRLATAMQALKLGFARRVLAEQRRRDCCPRPDLLEDCLSYPPDGSGKPGTSTSMSARRRSGWRNCAICIAIP
jgi:REP element-mobilizing transposase RayT